MADPKPPKCFDVDEDDATVELESHEDLSDRAGFDAAFLGFQTPLPVFGPQIVDDAVEVGGSTELRYEHFSLAMSRTRRMARWVVWNIDGARLLEEKGIGRVGFRRDRRLGLKQQITNYAYDKGNRLDRGHISRRADLLWGTFDEAVRANSDSFFYTNIAPQMDDFNQSMRAGLWGCLENAVYRHAKTGDRISVYGGPILDATDISYEDILVPVEFWKLLVYTMDGAPRAKAFALKQSVRDIDIEEISPKWEPFATRIGLLAERTKLDFGALAEWDSTVSTTDAEELETPIRELTAIDW